MNDLISRQAAIQEFKDLPDCPNGYSDTYDKARIIGVLEGLPPAQPEQRWVPCSSGNFPKIGQKVLCQCRAGIYNVLKWTSEGWEDDSYRCYMNSFVIAWQPLPEPYKGEDGEL